MLECGLDSAGPVVGCCEKDDEPFGSAKGRE